MSLKRRSLAAAAAFPLCATVVSAAEDPGSRRALEPMTVTATRTATDPDRVSRSVSIIPEHIIETRQSADVLDLMAELPGISSASNGGLAGQLVIRGFSTQGFRAPLFVDGDRFRGRNTIEYTLFDPEQIERIEVVRGPAAVIYGTDSFGGVINLITKRADGDVSGPFRFTSNRLSSQYSSVNDGTRSRLQFGGAGRGFDVLLGASYRHASDYDSPAGEIPNSGFEGEALDLRSGYTFAPGQRIELSGRYVEVERERAGGQFAAPGAANGPGVPQREMTDRPNRSRYLRLFYEGDYLFDGGVRDVESSLYWRDLYTHVEVVPDARDPSRFVDSFVTGPTVWGGRLKGVSDFSERLSLTYGGDWYYEDGSGSERSVSGGERAQTAPDADQLNVGLYGLAEWQATRTLRLDTSLRYDHFRTRIDTSYIDDSTTRRLFEDAGDTKNDPLTAGLGAVWEASDVASLFGNVSTSFRAPSVTEVSAVGSGVNSDFRVPNPDIEPERAVNYETGLRLRFPAVEFDVTAFTNEVDNLIDRNAPTTYAGREAVQIQNIGEARIRGVEIGATWFPSDAWQLTANATYTHGRDTENDRPLAQIMPWNGFVGARWEPVVDGYYIEGTLNWALDQDRVDKDQERSSDGYAVANLYAGYSLGRIWPQLPETMLRLSIENLFDKKYRLATTPEDIDYPVSPSNPLIEPGRNIVVGFSTRF